MVNKYGLHDFWNFLRPLGTFKFGYVRVLPIFEKHVYSVLVMELRIITSLV